MARNSPTTLDQWRGNKQHEVTLPSATKVKIQIPNLPALIKAGQIPNGLIEVALETQQSPEKITPERIKEQVDFFNYLVAITVVEPKVSEADVDSLPYEDVEMLVEFATRQRDIDAVYHHIGGLERHEDWRKFRGLRSLDPLGVDA